MKEKEIKRGQPITFRIPSDTPSHVLRHLQRMKETEKRNFSSKIAEYMLNGINEDILKQKETITIPLPNRLSKAQRNWLKHEHSEALLGNIVYQLLTDPIRTVSLLSSITSVNDDSMFEPQDEIAAANIEWEQNEVQIDSKKVIKHSDLENFHWDSQKEKLPILEDIPKENEDLDDLLGDFLAQMNK